MMSVARKGSLNARQRARLAVQVDQDKLKRQVDLFTEALTAMDARDQAEIRLGHALNELRGMGLSRADIAERTGLAPREVSTAMRAATENETLDSDDENGAAKDDDLPSSPGGIDGSGGAGVSGDSGDDQAVHNHVELDDISEQSNDPLAVH